MKNLKDYLVNDLEISARSATDFINAIAFFKTPQAKEVASALKEALRIDIKYPDAEKDRKAMQDLAAIDYQNACLSGSRTEKIRTAAILADTMVQKQHNTH